jgi:hypothetical protein
VYFFHFLKTAKKNKPSAFCVIITTPNRKKAMKLLKQKLAVAKALHAACKSPCPMPEPRVLAQARKYRDSLRYEGKSTFHNLKDSQFQENFHLVEALRDYERCAAYKLEKARLAQAIADIQAEILVALIPSSDLE